MNERIKELAKQAELNLELQSLRVEKFAELIVRECATISNAHMIECESINYGIGTKIRQHFGVER